MDPKLVLKGLSSSYTSVSLEKNMLAMQMSFFFKSLICQGQVSLSSAGSHWLLC